MSEAGTNSSLFLDAMDGGQHTAAPLAAALPLSPGAQLAHCRELRGWSVVEVADQLNLAPRQVQALEDENYAILPGPAVTRGFIRAYAKLLKVDPVALLAAVSTTATPGHAETPTRRPLPQTHYSDNRLNAVTSRPDGSRWYFVLLAALFLIGAVVLAQYEGWLPRDAEVALARFGSGIANLRGEGAKAPSPLQATDPASVREPAARAVPETSGSVQNELVQAQSSDAATSAGTPAPIAAAPSVPMQTPGAVALASRDKASMPMTQSVAPAVFASSNKPGLPTAPGAANVASAMPSVTPLGNQLVLNFRTDSWVALKGHGKNALSSKLYRRGTTASFDITEPVQLLVGNASGVTATLRGVPLPLSAPGKTNVARLVVK